MKQRLLLLFTAAMVCAVIMGCRFSAGTSAEYSKDKQGTQQSDTKPNQGQQSGQSQQGGGQGQQDERFEVQDGKLVKYTGTDEHVVIPESVKVIGKEVFSANTTIKTVQLPTGLLKIEDDAFLYSTLTKVTIPANVTEIGSFAFMGTKLTELKFEAGSKITKLPKNMCEICTDLTTVELPTGLQSIGSSAFSGCEKLSQITFPDTVHTIETNAFRETALTRVVLPANLQKLEQQAFYLNKELTEVVASTTVVQQDWKEIPENDNGISALCFCDNQKLQTIKFPDRLKTMSEGCLLGAVHLKDVTLPASIASISEGIIDLSSITDKVTVHVKNREPSQISINTYAFRNFDGTHKDKLFIHVPNGTSETFKKAAGWSTYQERISEESN
ncbi:leucine-rich repeat domain-containing protein [Treponema phagedenis]|uniref:leucine-rich repeat domain-containing protein n=2 Tax=Treponema phagedenis TaxID=162 RepID=UPI0011E89AC2|nr:leucine-rich repeat domain-containing protein [Treponema phagedenis]QEJ94281.1 leucine-rich repeat domain-containing protein [Treponema phagedenis]